MQLSIPKTFQLGGRTWTVKHVGRRKWLGICEPATCTISLSARNQDDEERLHTFLHELDHAIFWTMGKKKLYQNEMIVDAHAGLLLQALTTSI